MDKKIHLLVGSYGSSSEDAIQLLEWNMENYSFKKKSAARGIDSPSFITKNISDNFYAISEVDDGLVVSYSLGGMKEKSRQLTGGAGPCYIHVDALSEFIIVTNYGSGSVSLHPLQKNGTVECYSDIHTFYQSRSTGSLSHPHICYPLGKSDKYVITDLGQNKLYLYYLDRHRKKLVFMNEFDVEDGYGPRHVEFLEEKSLLYVVNEFQSFIKIFHYDDNNNQINYVDQIATIPRDEKIKNYCADIHLSPCQKYLYVSNRGKNSIVSFKVEDDGALQYHDEISTSGEWPRNFAISSDGTYLFVANEHSHSITVLYIDEDGKFHDTNTSYSIYKPSCLLLIN